MPPRESRLWVHGLVKHYAPSEFAELKRIGAEMGFLHVESGPLVRSSYHAERQVPAKLALPGPAQPADAGCGRNGMDVAQPV